MSAAHHTGSEPLLEVRELVKHFQLHSGPLLGRERGLVRAVDGVSFSLRAGETLALVGESGCGKSTVCRTLLRLIEPSSGSIRFRGREVPGLDRRELRALRREMQIVFQDPRSSLNPRRRIGRIVAEPLRVHRVAAGAELRRRVGELLESVGLAAEHERRFPHQLSGGERQRVGIARALALSPRLLLADEPVSALDLSVQAQIINLLADLRERLGLTYLLVAHDLAIVRQLADRIAVMRAGRIVEIGPADRVCTEPRHPYTQALLAAVPIPDPRGAAARRRKPG